MNLGAWTIFLCGRVDLRPPQPQTPQEKQAQLTLCKLRSGTLFKMQFLPPPHYSLAVFA